MGIVKILMGGGSVDKNNSGNGAGNTAGDGADKDSKKDSKSNKKDANKSGKDAKKDGKDADKGKDKSDKANGKDAKEKAKKKAESQDRSTGAMEKLSLKEVKALPACVAYVFKDQFDNASIRFRPSSGNGNKCAISADAPISNFDSIRREISKLGDDGSVNFSDVYVYAYGSLSKNGVGIFSGKNISSIDNPDGFDTSNVTKMSYLFKNSSLTNLNFLSKWDVSNVTNMESMFEGCTKLSDISGLKDWNVGKVGNMSGMFASVIKNDDKRDSFDPEGYEGLMAIKSLKPLSNWNVGNVGNMNRMFEGCTRLKDFTGLEKWDTKNVGSMIGMFRYCMKIGGGNESSNAFKNWDVSKVTDMRGMFAVTNIQNTVGLENWNVSNVEKMDDMFAMCSNLNSIKGLSNWNTKDKSSTSKLDSTYRMFYQCSSLASLDPLSSWNVGSVTDMRDMFNNCGSLTSLQPLSSWNVGKVKKMSSMFSSCTGLTSLSDLEKWNVGSVTDMSSMFSGCNHLNKLDGLGKWNVNKVENMSSMFSGCYEYDVDESGHVTNEKGLADITALSGWATKLGSVTDMSGMFTGCGLLKSLSNLKEWNVSSVENMSNMFSSCTGLTSLSDLEKWNVGNVTNMSSMFSGCNHLNKLDGLGKWNVSNVTNMSGMFENCYWSETNDDGVVTKEGGLTDISALSGWARNEPNNVSNVSKVTDMSGMFSGCKSLTGDVDLSKWDISNVKNLSSMFSGVGAESGNKLVLDFSNKTFTKPTDPDSHFSVDGMFDGFKGTLIANNLQSNGFENNPEDDPIKSHFAKGEIFSKDDNDSSKSDNIVVTNNVTILDTISNDDDLKKIAYYIPVKAKLMEPGDMPSCKCDGSGDSSGTTYTYNVPALYNSSNLEKKQDEKSQDYAYRVVKNSFASKFRSAIDSQSGKGNADPDDPNPDDPNPDDPDPDDPDNTDTGSRSAKLKLRVKKLRSIKKSRSVRDDEGEGEEVSEDSESSEEKQGNTYKIMFKKSSGNTCTWTELGNGDDNVPVSEPKSPLTFFNTMYYLETFVKPVPLPHTGGQSAVMFTFLSIGLFSMFAVAGAFSRHGWVASVLSDTALTGLAKAFGGGALDIASGAKHCFAHSVVSGSMLKTAVSAATGFFARFRSNDSTFGKHTKQR